MTRLGLPVILIVVLLGVAGRGFGDDGAKESAAGVMRVLGHGTALNRDSDKALEACWKRAQLDAQEKAFPMDVTVMQGLFRKEENGEIFEFFSSNVFAQSHALVVGIERLGHRFSIDPQSGDVTCDCTMEARIKERPPDPGFSISARLLRQKPTGELVVNEGDNDGLPSYRDGESLALEVASSADCYLTVFNVYGDGMVIELVPTVDQSECFHPAGRSSLPSPADRARGVAFTVHSVGRSEAVESIFVVGTRSPAPFVSMEVADSGGYRYLPTFEAATKELMEWLGSITEGCKIAEVRYRVLR